jgi:hypothetical protein
MTIEEVGMSRLKRRVSAICAAAMVLALAALLIPAGAGAATVVNGDFESGLSGWQTVAKGAPEDQSGWFVYSGTESPLGEHGSGESLPSPPSGSHAAITDQTGPSSDILYQEVALEPYWTHQLTMTLFYNNLAEAFAIPNPDTLSWTGEPTENEEVEGPANQQYRVDVMKAGTPINSVNPADILDTVFATKEGDPNSMEPTQYSVNLTPFAGQTVRLRFAMTDNQFYFNAGVDNVSILSTPPSNTIVLGKLKQNLKNGSGKLLVTVPGPGSVSVTDIAPAGKPARIAPKTLVAGAPGTLALPLKPSKAGRKVLKGKHQLKLRLSIGFTPTGGLLATQTRTAKLHMKPKHKKHHKKKRHRH